MNERDEGLDSFIAIYYNYHRQLWHTLQKVKSNFVAVTQQQQWPKCPSFVHLSISMKATIEETT